MKAIVVIMLIEDYIEYKPNQYFILIKSIIYKKMLIVTTFFLHLTTVF